MKPSTYSHFTFSDGFIWQRANQRISQKLKNPFVRSLPLSAGPLFIFSYFFNPTEANNGTRGVCVVESLTDIDIRHILDKCEGTIASDSFECCFFG